MKYGRQSSFRHHIVSFLCSYRPDKVFIVIDFKWASFVRPSLSPLDRFSGRQLGRVHLIDSVQSAFFSSYSMSMLATYFPEEVPQSSGVATADLSFPKYVGFSQKKNLID